MKSTGKQNGMEARANHILTESGVGYRLRLENY